jgi:hypothetical protein
MTAESERYHPPKQRIFNMKKAILAAAAIAALGATLGFAQAPTDDPHHPAAGTPQATPPAGQRGMMGDMPMMTMMGMPMMEAVRPG